jgi:hypothetical protein
MAIQHVITIPRASKGEFTDILKTTAALTDAKCDLISCNVDGEDVDLLIETDLDGWVVDGLLDAHLEVVPPSWTVWRRS